MRKIVESTITWRGSITDLATDVAWLMTPAEGEEFVRELERFLRVPGEAHKWAGKGHEEV
jgi:hypothetical protein